MKTIPVLLVLTNLTLHLFAQSNEEANIKQTINHLFTGMKKGDSVLSASAFSTGAIMQTLTAQTGKVIIKTETTENFLKFIGSPHREVFEERLTDLKILIDAPLASVWANYEFYIDGVFSHCGVDSFQLVRNESGWKIVYVIDTRRKDKCK